jgi:hypothetical protein
MRESFYVCSLLLSDGRAESGGQLCQVKSIKLALDVIIDWLEERH